MIKKGDIKKWLIKEGHEFLGLAHPEGGYGTPDMLAGLIHDCITELSQDKWVGVDKNSDYAELMELGYITFWHSIHKCEVTGCVVRNHIADALIQGEYSVVEKTKTTKWSMDAFSHYRIPSELPNDK